MLAVNTKAGVHRFVDKKPYREELDGFHWFYCGYLSALKAHLIGMEQDSLFTGKLLLDGDGRVIEGGQTVYPSAGGKLYLAESQIDGKDPSDWTLYDLAGHRLWAGEAGITRKDIMVMVFEAPQWIGDSAIRVTAFCPERPQVKGQATLIQDGKSWRWQTELRCKG